MSLTKVTYAMIQGAPFNVQDFGAVGDGSTDDTAAIQAAITACQTSGSSLYIPTGTYKTTSTLNITGKVIIFGDGNQSSIINFYSAATTNFAILISLPDNSSAIGLDIGHIGINCNAGAAVGSGISMTTTATNSAFSQSTLHDIYIKNVTIGVRLDGVIYMCDFSRITVSGSVTQYGWYSLNSLSQTIYNSFTNLEVTDVGNSGYAYYMSVSASQLTNLTADACCYFTGFYSNLTGLFIEGISATTPATTTALTLNAINSAQNIGIISVPNSKCSTAISYEGANIFLNNVLIPDSGAGNQPNAALVLYAGNIGVVNNFQMLRPAVTKIDNYTATSILNGFTITNSPSIFTDTNLNLSYGTGTWTPTFPTNWTTSPSVISAQYTKIGRQVTVTLYANNGVSIDGAVIGGLPFTSNATQGAGAASGCSDSTAAIRGSVTNSSTQISFMPAATLTGDFWQLTATYFV